MSSPTPTEKSFSSSSEENRSLSDHSEYQPPSNGSEENENPPEQANGQAPSNASSRSSDSPDMASSESRVSVSEPNQTNGEPVLNEQPPSTQATSSSSSSTDSETSQQDDSVLASSSDNSDSDLEYSDSGGFTPTPPAPPTLAPQPVPTAPPSRQPNSQFYTNDTNSRTTFPSPPWRCPSNDATLPGNDQDRRTWVARLIAAANNTTNVHDRQGIIFKHRWYDPSTGPSTFHSAVDKELLCWDILELAESLHLHGPSVFRSHDQRFWNQGEKTREWTFRERMEQIIALLAVSKARCDKLLAGQGLRSVIANPAALMASCRGNAKQNKRRQTFLEQGRGMSKRRRAVRKDDEDEEDEEDEEGTEETEEENQDGENEENEEEEEGKEEEENEKSDSEERTEDDAEGEDDDEFV